MAFDTYIYTMNDPKSGLVRYVGKTKNPTERFRKHLTENNGTYKSRWVKGLRSKGEKPVFEIIDQCGDNWEELERFYILFYKAMGAKLLNQMPGGEGGPTMKGRKLTQEQRQKITLSKIGKQNPGAASSNLLNKGKRVAQIDINGNIIAIHPSIREAGKAVSRNYRRIQAMVNNKPMNGKCVNYVAGFKFEYVKSGQSGQ